MHASYQKTSYPHHQHSSPQDPHAQMLYGNCKFYQAPRFPRAPLLSDVTQRNADYGQSLVSCHFSLLHRSSPALPPKKSPSAFRRAHGIPHRVPQLTQTHVRRWAGKHSPYPPIHSEATSHNLYKPPHHGLMPSPLPAHPPYHTQP